MLPIKITQRSLNTHQSLGLKLTKFCVILMTIGLTSCNNGTTKKEEVYAETSGIVENDTKEQPSANKTLLFFGDSITAGYGLDDTNDAYPALIQSKIDSLGLAYEVINSGLSGETTAGGSSRIQWILNQNIDVFVLELGANDGLRGVALQETRNNLQAIIDAVRSKNPKTKIVLAGMQLPPNMGLDYTTGFKNIFSEIAQKNNLALIPFILKDVGGIASLNQSDGIHPTIAGHKIVANTVWEVVEPIITE